MSTEEYVQTARVSIKLTATSFLRLESAVTHTVESQDVLRLRTSESVDMRPTPGYVLIQVNTALDLFHMDINVVNIRVNLVRNTSTSVAPDRPIQLSTGALIPWVGGDRMSLHVFILAAVLIEGLTGIVKSILTGFGLKLQTWMDQAISLVLAMAMATVGKMDFFVILSQVIEINLQFPAIFGMILSGLVLSRGSNAIHDLFKTMNPQAEGKRIW